MTPHEELMKFIRKGRCGITFEWINKETFGDHKDETLYERERIRINIYAILTYYFVHEYLHGKYPDLHRILGGSAKEETEIARKTERFMKRMSKKDQKRFAKYLLKNIKMV